MYQKLGRKLSGQRAKSLTSQVEELRGYQDKAVSSYYVVLKSIIYDNISTFSRTLGKQKADTSSCRNCQMLALLSMFLYCSLQSNNSVFFQSLIYSICIIFLLQNTYGSITKELQARYNKIEAELNVEKQRFLKLQKEFQELHCSNTSSLATAHSLELQLSETEVGLHIHSNPLSRTLLNQILQ